MISVGRIIFQHWSTGRKRHLN